MSLRSRAIAGGLVGGLVGAIIMTVILVATKMMVGLPPLADFMVMGTFVGGSGTSVVPAGLAAHFSVGIVDGIIFGVLVTTVGRLGLTSWARVLGLGIAFGFLAYLLVFLPVSMTGFAPIMMAMMGPSAAGLMPMVQGVAIFEHLIFGLVVATSVFAAIRSGTKSGVSASLPR
jgi:hypothetical protein